MRAYLAFTRKEITENLRTYKIFIMAAVFVLLGIMNPVLAKMLPEILRGVDMGGLVLDIPEPTAFDSFQQFFSNVGQIGLIVLVIIFSGIMSNEFSKGTLVNILAKGMKRRTVILSKFTVAVAIWTAFYLLCLASTCAYTLYFWEIPPLSNVFLSFAGLWLYGVLLIALPILGGVLFKTFYGALLLTGGAAFALGLVNIWPEAQKFNPATISGDNTGLLAGASPSDLVPAFIVCGAAIVLVMLLSVIIFNKKQV